MCMVDSDIVRVRDVSRKPDLENEMTATEKMLDLVQGYKREAFALTMEADQRGNQMEAAQHGDTYAYWSRLEYYLETRLER